LLEHFLDLAEDRCFLLNIPCQERILTEEIYAESIGPDNGYANGIGKENSMDLQEIMGRVIRRERQERRLTIKELGEKAGLSEIYVGEIERGQKYPSSRVLESIAAALELDIADLLEMVAEEIRFEREPEKLTVIGFTQPNRPGQPNRQAVRKMVNMLDEGDVESVANFSAFLLSKQFLIQ